MKVMIKATSDGVGYASKSPYEWEGKQYEADIQEGDLVEIINPGVMEPGKFGDQLYIKIKTRNGEKKAPFNQSSINVLAGEWGDETEQWVGKTAKVVTKKMMIDGERRLAVYYVTDGWYVDDWGDLTKDLDVPSETQTPQQAMAKHKERQSTVADTDVAYPDGPDELPTV